MKLLCIPLLLLCATIRIKKIPCKATSHEGMGILLLLRRARACISPYRATASEEVLSLHGQQRCPEDVKALLHKEEIMSISSSQAQAHGASYAFKSFLIYPVKAIFSFAVRSFARSYELKSCHRNSVNLITYRPAVALEFARISDIVRHCYFYVVRLYSVRPGGTQRHDGACAKLPALLGGNNDNRPALDHFRDYKPPVVTHNDLPGKWRFFDLHKRGKIVNSRLKSSYSYAGMLCAATLCASAAMAEVNDMPESATLIQRDGESCLELYSELGELRRMMKDPDITADDKLEFSREIREAKQRIREECGGDDGR